MEFQHISVKGDHFLKVYNAWKTGDDVEIECVRNIPIEHYIQSIQVEFNAKMVTENPDSSTCSSTGGQKECYVSRPNGAWTDLLKCCTFSPSKGSDLRPYIWACFLSTKTRTIFRLDFIWKKCYRIISNLRGKVITLHTSISHIQWLNSCYCAFKISHPRPVF